MTTVEFKKELEDLGYEWEYRWDYTHILIYAKGRNFIIANIPVDEFGKMVFNFDGSGLPWVHIEKLMELVTRYAFTLVEEREEEEFYWKLRGSEDSVYEGANYLHVPYLKDWWRLDIKHLNTFTQKEYDKLIERGLIADIFDKEVIED